jgi:hypothetical protein
MLTVSFRGYVRFKRHRHIALEIGAIAPSDPFPFAHDSSQRAKQALAWSTVGTLAAPQRCFRSPVLVASMIRALSILVVITVGLAVGFAIAEQRFQNPFQQKLHFPGLYAS